MSKIFEVAEEKLVAFADAALKAAGMSVYHHVTALISELIEKKPADASVVVEDPKVVDLPCK